MPDRYVRDALLRSSAWNSLTSAEAQNLFVRLLLVVDDFGCYDGRVGVIATQVFPINPLGSEELDALENWLADLHRAGLIIRYSNAGKPYIAIWQWGNDLRGNRKFPAPPIDVDVEGLKVRGKFGNVIGWTNPPGCDVVSILVGFDGRAVSPQPDEWRPAEHMRPATKKPHGWKNDTSGRQPEAGSMSQAASSMPHVAGGMTQAVQSPEVEVVSSLQSPQSQSPEEDSSRMPPATASPTATTTPNGEIKFEKGAGFVGLSEEQRVKWQEMFDDLRIPDQVARAAAWLEVHDDERIAIEKSGVGFGQFIVRWLLRESRGKPAESRHTGHAS